MASFSEVLAEIQRDCGWESIPDDKISMLARLCGPAEVLRLIRELDALEDADLEGDAGDMRDEYWRLRTSYSQALAEVGQPAIEPLLQALDSENPQTRAYAARALGRIGDQRAFGPIVAMLAEKSDGSIQMSLLEALGRLRDERAVEVLLPYLKTPQGVQNRGWLVRMAANALGHIGSEVVTRPLSEVLAADPDWFARLGGAEGLGKVTHPLAAEALRRALKDDDARVRAEARAGLR
jgi:HEAT repeat protein